MTNLLRTLLLLLSLSEMTIAQEGHGQCIPCSHSGHAMCVRITGREVFQEGAEGRWSQHWGQMSYIGRACEEQLGRRKGVFLESLFAVPHYMAMGVMNVAGLTKYAFTRKKRRTIETEPSDGEAAAQWSVSPDPTEEEQP